MEPGQTIYFPQTRSRSQTHNLYIPQQKVFHFPARRRLCRFRDALQRPRLRNWLFYPSRLRQSVNF